MSERQGGPVGTSFNILFVCTGNTCRSPMAEALARAEIADRGWRHVAVASAGVTADPGDRASEPAVSVTERRGMDLTSHSARRLDRELVAWADLILAMSPGHLDAIADLGGAERMALLGDFASGGEGGFMAVRDPFGGDERMYEATLTQLRELVSSALDRLSPIVQP